MIISDKIVLTEMTAGSSWALLSYGKGALFMYKEYISALTLEEQIQKIIEKNIIISNKEEVKWALKNHSYYSLINGYKRHFLADGETDKMIDGTNFNDFLKVYYLDNDLTEVIFKYILYVEKSLRARLAYEIAMQIGDSETIYLDRKHYKDTRKTRGYILNDIEKTIRNCRDESVTKYFKDNKQNIPPWIIVQDLSFSTIIGWLDILPYEIQNNIREDFFEHSHLYSKYQSAFFYNSLNFLREFRNKIAHGKIHFEEKTRHYLHVKSGIHFFNNTFYTDDTISNNPTGKDLYAAIALICGLTLDRNVAQRFSTDLFSTFSKYINTENGEVIATINGKSVYQIFNLPIDILERMTVYYKSISDF